MFDEGYTYLILQFAIVFLRFELVKKIILIAFAYQKWLHSENSQKYFKITKFSFSIFFLKLKALELICDYSVLYFLVVFQVWNIWRKFQFTSMNVRKVIAWRKFKKSILNHEISRFLKFPTLSLWKIECFPIKKNHLDFLTIKGYDVEQTNSIILDKNIVPLVGTRVPEGRSFLPLF